MASKKTVSKASPKAPSKTAPKKAPATRKKPAPILALGSPMAAYEKKLTPWQLDLVQGADALVKKLAPGAVAVIKWGHPVYERNGKPFALVRAAAKHVLFGFWGTVELDDPNGLLEGDSLRHLKLKKPADLAVPDLARFIKASIKANGAG